MAIDLYCHWRSPTVQFDLWFHNKRGKGHPLRTMCKNSKPFQASCIHFPHSRKLSRGGISTAWIECKWTWLWLQSLKHIFDRRTLEDLVPISDIDRLFKVSEFDLRFRCMSLHFHSAFSTWSLDYAAIIVRRVCVYVSVGHERQKKHSFRLISIHALFPHSHLKKASSLSALASSPQIPNWIIEV